MMKFIFIFLFLLNLNPHSIKNKQKDSEPEINYQLKDQKIIKQMSDPIIITNQSENLLNKNSYLKQVQLVLPSEDLNYIRSNKIDVNLSFSFQFEWWNPMQHQFLPEPLPKVYQSLKAEDIIARPRHLVTRLIWDSNIITNSRQLSHMILFYYDDNFNLMMANQLETDLSDWEIKAVSNEAKSAPRNYQIILKDFTIIYPLPIIFIHLQTKFLEISKLFSSRDWLPFWNEFWSIFLNEWLSVEDAFDEYFIKPNNLEEIKNDWDQSQKRGTREFNLKLDYHPYFYLKIYQYFFPTPVLKIIYHQYLDLNLEFDDSSLVIKKHQNPWEAFRLKYQKWQWYLTEDIAIEFDEKNLFLNSKNSYWVKGEAKINLIVEAPLLSDLPLTLDFDVLQFANNQELEEMVFNAFKEANNSFFNQELFKHYSIIKKNKNNQFTIKSLEGASFEGEVDLTFKEIKLVTIIKKIDNVIDSKSHSLLLILMGVFLGIIIFNFLILVFLKFAKSKPPKK